MREASDREALWHALRSGVIDMIATDHAPHTAEVRTRLPIWRAECGFPGVERQMPLMLTEVARGRLAIEPYLRIAAEAPAKAFGLWPTQGRAAPGAHADIAVVDPRRTEVIRAAALHSRAKVTPFDGVTVTGVPVHTLVSGPFVQRARRFVTDSYGGSRPVTEIQRMPATVLRNADLAIDRLAPRLQPERPAA